MVDVVFTPGFEETLLDESRPFIMHTAGRIEELAKVYVPFDTGHLYDSIHVEPLDRNGARIGSDVEYSIYQELGTRYMDAQPYLRPATDEVLRYL